MFGNFTRFHLDANLKIPVPVFSVCGKSSSEVAVKENVEYPKMNTINSA